MFNVLKWKKKPLFELKRDLNSDTFTFLDFYSPAVIECLESVCCSSPWSSSLWSGRWRRRWWPRGRQRAPRQAWSHPPAPPGVWSSWWTPRQPGETGRGYWRRSGSAPGRWWRWEPGWTEPGCSQPGSCPLREEMLQNKIHYLRD